MLLVTCKSKQHFNILASSLHDMYSNEDKNHKYTCERTASSKFGLKINIKKTEVMFQPNSTMTMEEDINADETTLTHVKEFTYLGSIIASDGHIEAELQKRMSKASMSFGRFWERLWNNQNVSIRVKGKIYRAIMLSTLLYGAETWTVYRRHVKKLHAFMMRHLRSIMKIRWQDKVTNIKVLNMADSLLWKTSSSERISAGQAIFWGCQLTAFRDRFSTRSYQTDNDRVAAHVSDTKTQSRET